LQGLLYLPLDIVDPPENFCSTYQNLCYDARAHNACAAASLTAAKALMRLSDGLRTVTAGFAAG
jgi:hypothetical protein